MAESPEAAEERRRLVLEIEDRIRAGEASAALMLAREGVEHRPNSVQLRDCLAATLDLSGDAETALELSLDTARRRIRRLERSRGEPTLVRRLASNERVFISGYFYSGSGAVLDYLRGFEGSVKWTPAGEMRLIKFPGGLADIARRHRRQRELVAQDLLDLYLHLVGRKAVTTPRGVYNPVAVVNGHSRKLLGKAEAAGYVLVGLRHFLDLAGRWAAGPFDRGELDERFRNWVREALDAAATDTAAERLVIDQAVTAWRIKIARFVPPSTFLVVHRDPRDQFAESREVLRQPGRKERTAATFVRTYRRHRELVSAQIPVLEGRYGHRFLQVSFEDFVRRHDDTASQLREAIDVDGAPSAGYFDPAVSSRNVGKYPDHLTRREARRIERRLRGYLSPHV